MLKITYETLSDSIFLNALQRLSFFRNWADHEELFKVKELFKKCRQEQVKAGKEWSEISLKYADKNKEGKIKFLDENGNYNVSKDNKEAFEKAKIDFDNFFFEIDIELLKLKSVLATGISPAELGVIEGLCEPKS